MIVRAKRSGNRLLMLAVAGWLWATAPSVYAFKLIPMSLNLEPAGRGANGVFRVENDSDQEIAVMVSLAKREMDLNGKESLPPEEDDFSVYPPQMTLGPQKSQAVRIRWIGDPKPARELAYRIIAEQLPVSLSREGVGSRINLVVRYIGSIYVVPNGVKSEVVVDSVAAEKDKEGAWTLVITLENRGTAHTLLEYSRLQVASDGRGIATQTPISVPKGAGESRVGEKASVDLGSDELKGMEGENILAGHKRRFVLPWPKGLRLGQVQVKFEYGVPPRVDNPR